MSRGKLIVLEGADGSGTTSQGYALLKHMKSWLGEHSVCLMAQPSKGPIGAFIRRVLTHDVRVQSRKAMELLFRADRMEHIETEIEPKLASGCHVILDRYYPSTLVYQAVHRDSILVSFEEMQDIADQMFRGEEGERIVRPDVMILLGVTIFTAMDRRQKRGDPEELYEAEQFQEKVIKLYSRWAVDDRYPGPKFILDGNRSKSEVQADVQKVVELVLNGKPLEQTNSF